MQGPSRRLYPKLTSVINLEHCREAEPLVRGCQSQPTGINCHRRSMTASGGKCHLGKRNREILEDIWIRHDQRQRPFDSGPQRRDGNLSVRRSGDEAPSRNAWRNSRTTATASCCRRAVSLGSPSSRKAPYARGPSWSTDSNRSARICNESSTCGSPRIALVAAVRHHYSDRALHRSNTWRGPELSRHGRKSLGRPACCSHSGRTRSGRTDITPVHRAD
jgi:hypothetical protein